MGETQLNNVQQQLEELRAQIDGIDNRILELFGQRMQISDTIGLLKRDHQVTIVQNNRFNELSERLIAGAEQAGISRDFMQVYLEALHKESIRRQEVIKAETARLG